MLSVRLHDEKTIAVVQEVPWGTQGFIAGKEHEFQNEYGGRFIQYKWLKKNFQYIISTQVKSLTIVFLKNIYTFIYVDFFS